jgi:hypothetical protein
MAYLVQSISDFPQPPLNAVSAFIPFPTTKKIIIYAPLVDENVLCEFGRVVVE